MRSLRLVHERWHRWNCLAVTSPWLKLHIVPDLGGRIVNYQLGDHAFLWTNPLSPESDASEPEGRWPNWGGDKVWLAPQGWDNEDQWAGPPDPVLDAGCFRAEQIDAAQGQVRVRLTSPHDPRSGMQISRVLSIDDSSTRLEILCTMTNLSNRERRWGLWPVTQINAASSHGEGWNTKLRACVPLSRTSMHPSGYRVIYGSAANPQYHVDGNTLEVRYEHRVGKIGADSDAGWVAIVDGETGNVLVQQITFDSSAEYPDHSSVEIWTNGRGTLHAYRRTEEMPDDIERNPYMLECELISPFARLQPGESFEYAYSWASTNIGADDAQRTSILSCNQIGCEVDRFQIGRTGELSGRFGTFLPGECFVAFTDKHDVMSDLTSVGRTTPLAPLVLKGVLQIPNDARCAVLTMYKIADPLRPDKAPARIGELARYLL